MVVVVVENRPSGMQRCGSEVEGEEELCQSEMLSYMFEVEEEEEEEEHPLGSLQCLSEEVSPME